MCLISHFQTLIGPLIPPYLDRLPPQVLLQAPYQVPHQALSQLYLQDLLLLLIHLYQVPLILKFNPLLLALHYLVVLVLVPIPL